MKKNKQELRKYHSTDATLMQSADMVLMNVTRDLADFASRNVTETTLEALHDLIEAFKEFPTDGEFEGDVMVATEIKNEQRKKLIIQIRLIKAIAQVAFQNSNKYSHFKFKNIARLSDADLLNHGKSVGRISVTFFSEMESAGLTQAILDDLEASVNHLKTALNDKEIAKENRTLAVIDRLELGNQLYEEISRLSLTGKSIYFHNNDSKYKQYRMKGL